MRKLFFLRFPNPSTNILILCIPDKTLIANTLLSRNKQVNLRTSNKYYDDRNKKAKAGCRINK